MKERKQPLTGEKIEELMTPEEIGGLTNQYLAALRSAQGSPLMVEVAEDCVNQMSELLHSQNAEAKKQGQEVVLNIKFMKPIKISRYGEGDMEEQMTVLKNLKFIGFQRMPSTTGCPVASQWYLITGGEKMQSFDPSNNIESIEISEVPLKMPVAA